MLYLVPSLVVASDMLFSPYGNIRRIKVYRDKDGHPKGDALITYAKPGSATSAISKVFPLSPVMLLLPFFIMH